jgi:hypothetical protein
MDYRDPKPACRFISKILISLLKSLRRRFAKFIANLN